MHARPKGSGSGNPPLPCPALPAIPARPFPCFPASSGRARPCAGELTFSLLLLIEFTNYPKNKLSWATMSDDSLTHGDLSRLLGISVTTLKSYRRKFPGFLPALASGKPLRFPAQAAQVCADIRDGFARGLSVQDLHKLLTSRYPRISKNRHLSISQAGPEPDLAPALDTLTQELTRLGQRLDSALERLDRLEAAQATVHRAEPDALPQSRIIRIRTRDGEHQRFQLTPLGPDPEAPPAPAPAPPAPLQPPPGLLEHPLVVRSGQGEFLGLGGSRSRPFRLRDLLDIMAERHDAALPPAWTAKGDGWTLAITLGAPPFRQDHVLQLETTTTPRGNQVTLLSAMAVGDKPVPHTFLHAFLRQLGREQEA